ncbi:BHLH domain-containing protein [Mycena kentingensis (nom. inval.)]|nr:BHLH domain-containing protein [Mycena kentingensis (nom. inval.)]
MEFDHAPKTPSYMDAADAGFSYMDSEYIRYPPTPPAFESMDLTVPVSPAAPAFHELHSTLGLNNTLNDVYYQPSSPSSSTGTAPGFSGSPTQTFTQLDGGASIAPSSVLGPSYTLSPSIDSSRRGSGSISPPVHAHSPSAAIPRALANVSRRYNPIARPARRKPAARRSAEDDSEDEDDDFQPAATTSLAGSGGSDSRRETIRRQRIESEQRRRDELRDGKVSLLDRATNHVRNLEIAKSELEKRLLEAESTVKHLRDMNEALSLRVIHHRGHAMVATY